MQQWVQRVEQHTARIHQPALGGAGGGLVVGGGIGGANGTGGGGDLAATVELQDNEIKKLKAEFEQMKKKAEHDSRITLDNLVEIRNERQEDDQIRTGEMDAMEDSLNDSLNDLGGANGTGGGGDQGSSGAPPTTTAQRDQKEIQKLKAEFENGHPSDTERRQGKWCVAFRVIMLLRNTHALK